MPAAHAPHSDWTPAYTERQHYILLSIALAAFTTYTFFGQYPTLDQTLWFLLWVVILLRAAYEVSER